MALPAKGLTVLLADVRELILQAREGGARAPWTRGSHALLARGVAHSARHPEGQAG
jgi:hypothetical protein